MGIISPVATDSNGNAVDVSSTSSLGKDDFLELLITKMTYQDPLNPMDDEDFIAQLAEFSSLEQMQNISGSLDESLEWDYLQMQTINNTMATTLIGREVQADYSGVYLGSNNTPDIYFTTDTYAKDINIKISDADGNVVRTISMSDIEAGDTKITWDGKDTSGERLDEGYYTIDVYGYDANGDSFDPSVFLQGAVTGIAYHDGAAYVKVNGIEISLSEIQAINEVESDEE